MLYYPFVQPPRDIVAQGILYWDQVGSIVPGGYDLPQYLQLIAREGIYQPIEVDQYFDDISLEAIAAEVDQLLRGFSSLDLAIPPDPLTSATRLYYGKLPMVLEEMLVDRGAIADEGSAFQGSQELLGPLLALLARSVADADRNPTLKWVCHTDTLNAHKVAFEPSAPGATPAWRVEMGTLFKVPTSGIKVEELLDFRQRYNAERVALLRAVDQFVDTIGGPEAPDLLPRIAEEIDYAVNEIEEGFRKRGIKLKKAGTYGTIAAGAGAAAAASSSLGPLSEAAATGVFGVIGSLLMGATSTQVKPAAANPYNYLHRARRQFGAS